MTAAAKEQTRSFAERGHHLPLDVAAPQEGPAEVLGGAPGIGATDEDTQQHDGKYTQVNECLVTS